MATDVQALARQAQGSLRTRARRKLALQDPVFFAREYLPKKTLTDFQERWLVQAADDSIKNYELIAAVGHGKSYALTFVLPLWWLCRNRDDRILIVSNTQNLAHLTVALISTQLVDNEPLVRDFGPFYKPNLKWTDSELVVVRDDETDRTPTLKAVGMGGSIEGFRPRRAIVDDLTALEDEISEAKSEATRRWINEQFYPRLDPPRIVRVLSGRWHPEDIPHYWSKKPGMVVETTPAINPDGTALWPEQMSLEEMEVEKGLIGSHAFSGRYLCDPSSIEGNRFKRIWFKRFALKDLPPRAELEVVAGVDPALGKKSKDDNFAITVMARHRETKQAYVVDHVGGIYTIPQQHEIIEAIVNEWQPSAVAIEDVHFQWEAYKVLRARLPVTPLKPHGMDKKSRIETLAAHVENGSIIWRADHRQIAELIYELLLFPDSKRDDRGDATEIAWRKLTTGSASRLGKAFKGARW